MSGYSREEALSNSSIALSLWANPEDREKVVSLLADNNSIRNWEARFRKKSGELLDSLMSGETLVLNGNEPFSQARPLSIAKSCLSTLVFREHSLQFPKLW